MGLGTESQNLFSFITPCPTLFHGGVNNFGVAFLPAVHQGVPLGTPGYPNTLAKDASFHYMANNYQTPEQQRLQLQLLRCLYEQNGAFDPILEARIQSYELAFRMQAEAPEVTDLKGESQSIRDLYGLSEPETENFGTLCLLACRFVGRDVCFIQESYAHTFSFNNEQWDQHAHLEAGYSNQRQADRQAHHRTGPRPQSPQSPRRHLGLVGW
ncbi:MAG: hypothetical protein M2R45_05297 [Verrucomicrobia subdivision 3 bacterium]|nr:hypothetical protein [Limisphaerales bacterium]MCS1417824.1 hypothetical protein [Limisphaerales bacterium]